MFIILAKTFIALICAGTIGVLLFYRKQVQAWLNDYTTQKLTGIWLLTRLMPFVVTFLLLDYTPFSDIDGFYGQALGALSLKMVYRDFYCMYSPLFPYLNALALWLWTSKKAIVLLMIFMEGLALWLSLRFFGFHDKHNTFSALLYLLMPGSLVLCVFGGQEDIWLWLSMIGAYLLAQQTSRVEWFGVGLVLGFMLTKAVFILVGPALLLLLPKPYPWLWPMVGVGTIALGILYYFTGWLWLEQPMNEAATLRAPNWLSVLNPLTFGVLHAGAKLWNMAGLLITTFTATWLAYRVRHLDFKMAFSAVFVVLYATMMVAQQSAYSNYIFIFLLPLLFAWIDLNNRQEVAILVIYNVLSVVHPSLWWRLQRPYYNSPAEIIANPLYTLDYALQVGVVLCTLYFIRLVWRKAVVLKVSIKTADL